MKKNLIIYSLLLSSVISTIDCIDFEKQKNTVINALLMGALVSGFHYVYGKIETRKLENTLPDAPPHFQKWAREILAKNGLANADTIPIKIGMGPEGAVVGGSFFQFRPNIIIMIEGIFTEKIIYSELDKKKILSEIERVILHEKKHYDNGDFGKKCLSSGITAASTMLLMDWIKPEKSVYSTCVKGIIATASGLKIRNIPYIIASLIKLRTIDEDY